MSWLKTDTQLGQSDKGCPNKYSFYILLMYDVFFYPFYALFNFVYGIKNRLFMKIFFFQIVQKYFKTKRNIRTQ